MALAFPAGPTDGDVYTAEGATWTWQDARKLWVEGIAANANLNYVPLAGGVMTGDLTVPGGASAAPNNAKVSNYAEFHDPAGKASWSILGNRLECWGVFTMAGGAASTVTLPKTYANTEFTILSNYDRVGVPGAVWSTYTAMLSTNTFQAGLNMSANFAPQAGDLAWHTTGEWDGVS